MTRHEIALTHQEVHLIQQITNIQTREAAKIAQQVRKLRRIRRVNHERAVRESAYAAGIELDVSTPWTPEYLASVKLNVHSPPEIQDGLTPWATVFADMGFDISERKHEGVSSISPWWLKPRT